jgi:hypothetical protein
MAFDWKNHNARNAVLLRTLAAKGVDLKKPRVIECNFFGTRNQDAMRLAGALVAIGFSTDVRPMHSEPGLWDITATLTVSPEWLTNENTVKRLVRVARRNNSEFEGWGTAVSVEEQQKAKKRNQRSGRNS